VFLKHVIANHGLPEQLISDRDKLLTSNLWTALMQHVGVKHKMSTAYHPQTDGQTERLIKLWSNTSVFYIDASHNNWVGLLPLAQIAYNQSPTTTTGTSPFYANFGFEARDITGTIDVLADNPTAALTARELVGMHANLRLDLTFCRQQMTK
jgi:transposase InsO family protein